MRSKSLRRVIILSADCTSVSISAEMECSVLNRKCGWIWLFSEFKCALASCPPAARPAGRARESARSTKRRAPRSRSASTSRKDVDHVQIKHRPENVPANPERMRVRVHSAGIQRIFSESQMPKGVNPRRQDMPARTALPHQINRQPPLPIPFLERKMDGQGTQRS